jgi:CRISPR-associated protein Csx10
MEPESGFYTLFNSGKEKHYVRTRERYHSQTRVALSRFRRAASEGMLYSATAVSPKTDRPDGTGRTDLAFVGRVSGPDDSVNELLIALQATAIGSMRTRGYGLIKATEIEMGLVPLSVRLKAFNDLLVTRWQDLKRLATNTAVLPDRPDGCYFSVDLLAPAIFRNRGLPTLVPSLEVNNKTLRPVFWLTRADFAAGWSDAWGLPKPTALAARMGSVYVFRWNGEQNVLTPALQQLEVTGVGERRDESFGECWICHPFHQEVSEQ